MILHLGDDVREHSADIVAIIDFDAKAKNPRDRGRCWRRIRRQNPYPCPTGRRRQERGDLTRARGGRAGMTENVARVPVARFPR